VCVYRRGWLKSSATPRNGFNPAVGGGEGRGARETPPTSPTYRRRREFLRQKSRGTEREWERGRGSKGESGRAGSRHIQKQKQQGADRNGQGQKLIE